MNIETSIITPIYNAEDYLEETLVSIINQTYDKWEAILINDNSSDDSLKLAQRFAQLDPRFKIINKKYSVGAAKARNEGIEAARGRYIAFLDSDDIWDVRKLEKQIYFMQEGDIGFSYTGYSNINEQGKLQESISVPDKVDFNRLLKHNYIGCLTAVYDTQYFGKIYMPLVKKRQDFALWLELLKRFKYAYGLQSNLGFYRIRAGSLSRSKIDAFRYYWHVLRDVGDCGYFFACYNLLCYLFIVLLKKKYIKIYHKFFVA